MSEITREIVSAALKGDEKAMAAITAEAESKGRDVVILQRKLQVHFYSADGVTWLQETVMWSPWHQAHNEPDYYINDQEGRAFRTVRKEQRIELIPKEYMDPAGITRILTKRQTRDKSVADLQKMLQDAIKDEAYERAAEIRDEIAARSEP